ncbi:carboxymuconolactone decarboxylase family protein [Rhizosphaericola mali]|uniref:Carboxymuconolactone decarboxylase family protein n=1 Tax=Rhizosphaericola mali TaxID=2545455 RepID=A0A5P2G8U6_9BACT|nr:carboxymuconolactone decarboxylase family protein [Rhizosphaericola mali]QES87951.1 carboxymuconolactone decarboxylase family protein [Rhizosphaericola mali]
MKSRMNLAALQPEAYKAMLSLEKYLQTVDISPILKELIKLRTSQINGCAFCLDMHSKDAIKLGETSQRIFVLSAWRETNLFSEEEKAAILMTEEITLIQNQGLSESTYQNALKYFSEIQIAQIIMAIITINAWNRIAISTHMEIV